MWETELIFRYYLHLFPLRGRGKMKQLRAKVLLNGKGRKEGGEWKDNPRFDRGLLK